MPNQTIKGAGFHHVAIRTHQFDASLRFYIEGLGFSEKITWGEKPARAVMLDTGDGNDLEVFEREGVPAETSGEANILHFALRCDDCESATEAARGGREGDDGTESAGRFYTNRTQNEDFFCIGAGRRNRGIF